MAGTRWFDWVMRNSMDLSMTTIGFVRGGRTEPSKDYWGNNRCRLELDRAQFTAESLAGLDQLSHIEVVTYFHLAADEPIERGARHPRGRSDWPRVGIFAQRGRMRPNRIGISVCRILGIRELAIEVVGLDAVDGTPILDIKPVWSGYAPRGALREPPWAQEIMAEYWSDEPGKENSASIIERAGRGAFVG
jgi:tRNA (Thr-GGU) A37 N-methylase